MKILKKCSISLYLVALAALTIIFYQNQVPLSDCQDIRLSDGVDDSNRRLMDFSYAGQEFGPASLSTSSPYIVDVTKVGANGHDDVDDTAAFRKAVRYGTRYAEKHNTRVKIIIPKGNYLLSNIVKIEHGQIEIEGIGDGEDRPTIKISRSLSQITKIHEMNINHLKERDTAGRVSRNLWSFGMGFFSFEGTPQ